MQHMLKPYSQRMEPFVWWDGAFSEQELNWLQEKARTSGRDAQIGVGDDEVLNTSIRRSQVSWLHNTPDVHWVFEKLGHIASSLNSQYYQFDLTGFGEALQLTHYDQSEHGMYGWHQDYGSEISRKLSMVVQLSDPTEYEGGNLQVFTRDPVQNVRKQRGLITVFPSYVVHQVTPVTQGNRQSLVAWVSGPAFK